MATSSSAIPELPNPLTPMAFLPPDLAYQTTITTYLFVGATGILIWDMLNNLHEDYLILLKYRIGGPTIAYFVSRVATLAFVLGTTIFITAPVGVCAQLQTGVDWTYPIAVPATSLLFFFRVRAVFEKNRYVVGFFAFMWLAVVAGCLTVTQGIEGINIGPTKYCLNGGLAPYVSAAAIIPLVNDTLVFLAITWKLMKNSHREYTISEGVRTFVFGDFMLPFSRAIFQDGQVYYLTTVTANLLNLIMLYQKSIPPAYRTMFTLPNLMLMNIMASRVFRNTKLAIRRETKTTQQSLPIRLSMRSGINFSDSGRGTTQTTNRNSSEVTKTVEFRSDIDTWTNSRSGKRLNDSDLAEEMV